MSQIQLAPRDEIAALRAFATTLEKENQVLVRGYCGLMEVIEAVMRTRDIVNQIGTQAAMQHVYDCITIAMQSVEHREIIAMFEDDLEYSVWCTDCGCRLSEASEAAGACLKCIARN